MIDVIIVEPSGAVLSGLTRRGTHCSHCEKVKKSYVLFHEATYMCISCLTKSARMVCGIRKRFDGILNETKGGKT